MILVVWGIFIGVLIGVLITLAVVEHVLNKD